MRAISRVTAQNQVSVPAEVRRKYAIGPGSDLIWEDDGTSLRVRPKKFSLVDLQEVFAPAPSLSLSDMRKAKAAAVIRKVARGRR